MKRFAGRRRGGFTLIETLAVMAVSGILISVLVPGIMVARETAFRAYCQNNLHQIGTGLIHYESTHGRLPGWGLLGFAFISGGTSLALYCRKIAFFRLEFYSN